MKPLPEGYELLGIRYVRDGDNTPRGALAAVRYGAAVIMGWSWCAPVDMFSYEIARDIAIGRALKDRAMRVLPNRRSRPAILPYRLRDEVAHYIDYLRCRHPGIRDWSISGQTHLRPLARAALQNFLDGPGLLA